MKIKHTTFNLFLLLNGAICLTFILLFRPVTVGDADSYIDLAKQIFNLPGASDFSYSHRSPLYSFLLGIAMLIFGEEKFLISTLILQYILVFFVSFFIYRIFYLITEKTSVSFWAGLISTLNLSTIFLAYNILTEILALFIFTLLVYQLVLYYFSGRRVNLIIAAVLSGLMVLTRFNTIGIPLVLSGLILLIQITRKEAHKTRKALSDFLIATFCSFLVLNSWALYNYQKRDFYGVIPKNHMGQRWAIAATINDKSIVSDQYKDILLIFLNATEKLNEENTIEVTKKGSLLNIPLIRKLINIFKPPINGFYLYKSAEPELLKYYNLTSSSKDLVQLGQKLKPFYKEISASNRQELLKLRVYSFLYTFKYVSPTLPSDMYLNMNKLPDFVIKAYKLLFLFISVFVFFFSFLHSAKILLSKDRLNSYKWLILYSLIWYFPLINFYANVLDDANRFKFPAESIMLGLFVCFIDKILTGAKNAIKVNSK